MSPGMFHFGYRDMNLFAFGEFNFKYCLFACGIAHLQLEILTSLIISKLSLLKHS